MSDLGTGLAAVAGAVVLFGVFSLPTKSYRTGDGVFFTLCMALGIFWVGCCVFWYQCTHGHNAGIDSSASTCPQFVPLASVGGVVWCTSNLLLVPIVDCIGVGLCMLVWGMGKE
jgi:hypothetical protein